MRSPDGGETWQRLGIDQGLHSDALVRSLLNRPDRPEVVFTGTERGLYRSDDAGKTWRLLDSPLSEHCVWALSTDPADPDTMFAGTGISTPAAIFRSGTSPDHR